MSRAGSPSNARTVALLSLILLAPVLSGCLGLGGEDSVEESDLETKRRAEVTQDTGGIEGVVTDEAIQAIEGVTVKIKELSQSTQTADDGSFAFSEVQPGTYTLQLTADGFIGTEKTVDVTSGSIATVDVVLAHEPTVQPYTQQFQFQGFMECGVGAAGAAVIGSFNPCSEGPLGEATNTQTTFFHDIEPNAWQIVTEVTWEPNTPAGDRFWLAAEPEGFNSAWKVAYANEVETSPIISHTTRADLAGIVQNATAICEGEEDPELTSNHADNPDAYCGHNPIENGDTVGISVYPQGSSHSVETPEGFFPVGAGAAIQQDFTVFQTVFYNTPACEDFSVIEDNTCEQVDQPPAEDPYDEISGGNQTSGNQSAR